MTLPVTFAPGTIATEAGSFDEALRIGLAALCDQRPHLLAHAVRAVEPRSPLRALGVLCGEEALGHAALGSALFRLRPPGTGLTRAAVRDRAPVWLPSIPDAPGFVRRELLVRHGVRAGAAYPIAVGSKIAAVVEVLGLCELDRDAVPADTVAAVTAGLAAAAARSWGT